DARADGAVVIGTIGVGVDLEPAAVVQLEQLGGQVSRRVLVKIPGQISDADPGALSPRQGIQTEFSARLDERSEGRAGPFLGTCELILGRKRHVRNTERRDARIHSSQRLVAQALPQRGYAIPAANAL